MSRWPRRLDSTPRHGEPPGQLPILGPGPLGAPPGTANWEEHRYRRKLCSTEEGRSCRHSSGA